MNRPVARLPTSPDVVLLTLTIGAGLLSATVIAGLALGHTAGSWPTIVPSVVLVLGCFPIGLFVLRARPGNRVGLSLSLVGITALVAVAATAWSALGTPAWLAEWAWWPPWVLVVATLTLYPGRAAIGLTRTRLLVASLAAGSVSTVALAVATGLSPGLLTAAVQAEGAVRALLVVAATTMLVVVGAAIGSVVDLVRRARSGSPVERSRLRALLPAGMLIVGGLTVEVVGLPYATVPGLLALPIGMGIAILAHHLDDLDLLVNRAVVWLILTALLFAAFAGTVALLSTTALAGEPIVVSALGTAAVAVGFDPVRRRVQRAVDRLLFGETDSPVKVLSDLGRRMQAAVDPGELLADLVAAVGTSLRVPYVRMEVHGHDGLTLTTVEDGRPQPGPGEFVMRAHGEQVGRLLVAPRRTGEVFTSREAELLQDIAGQAAIAARSYRVTLELRQARESLVRSREDERLRIRRDLHDGLGPALAGARMQVAAARHVADTAPELLGSVQDTLAECSREVRRIVDNIRPGALDRGLLPAIRHRADAIGPVPQVTVEATGDLNDLGAAVEVAVYRIVTEALSNAAHHSGAEHLRVMLDGTGAQLLVEVRDDGRGGAAPREGGIGLESMRQRTEELGGRFALESGTTGTVIRLTLPR
ncbi:MAG: GAF domain-containing sensor histidine kinase [Propionibacterium sp.]|nr:GAF domain-containing sensor histidine kinase [Propionibacterium sp.]